jgi:hypothetical protein
VDSVAKSTNAMNAIDTNPPMINADNPNGMTEFEQVQISVTNELSQAKADCVEAAGCIDGLVRQLIYF